MLGPVSGKRSAVLAILAIGCGGSTEPGPLPQEPVRVLEYNVQAHVTLTAEPDRGARIAAQIAEIAPALIGFSECSPCGELVDQLGGAYELVTEDRAGVTAAYDSSLWRAGDRGFLTLGRNDDGWGDRVALWVEFEEIASGAPLLFYSTHWCVVARRPDDRCDAPRQLAYAHQILSHAANRSTPILLTGDLNVIEGSADDAPVRAFADEFVDTLRAIVPTGEIVTFATGLRLDYVFASPPVDVLDAWVDDGVSWELGSDHRPVVSTVLFR
jgi:endonuclease/exonuclease/phosphatase family metal-dependent hydrolase